MADEEISTLLGRVALKNRDAFAAMKKTAWLINVGRGATVDEEALLDALRDHGGDRLLLDLCPAPLRPGDHPGALRLDAPVATFLNYLVTLRYNAHYGDVNAAGSYFVMALLPALAFARTVSLWRWIAPVALILIALSLSGSRAALLGGVLGAGIVWLVDRSLQHRTRQPSRRRTAALIGVISGTYSSIFNASQLLVSWDEWTRRRRARRLAASR